MEIHDLVTPTPRTTSFMIAQPAHKLLKWFEEINHFERVSNKILVLTMIHLPCSS